MSEPRTATGRRLFTDMDPMDMWESDGVTPGDVAAVECEAAALERERLRADWEDRKRTRASVMHDVGYTMAEVDDLLSEPTP